MRPGFDRIVFHNDATVRKNGDLTRLIHEVEAMEYVKSHTSVPMPMILQTSLGERVGTEGFFIMQRLPGIPLDVAWPMMTDESKFNTVEQLRFYIQQLHALTPPAVDSPKVGSVSGGPPFDHRLSNRNDIVPFASVSQFHDFLVVPIEESQWPEWAPRYRRRLSDRHRSHFAHGDLGWDNILVDDSNGDVIGILDWEMAGVWPEWWEFRQALSGPRCNRPWWRDILGQIMKEYPKETNADMHIERF
ncbi:hypothetical protein NLG97_g4821 [Lecanicillium saksenae]|uniref:Uncharacterized protein n=1 Tax=Lecanicillium saksenae TaxID=468837 RepID=A0ACC1QUS8_9HYPO|nr:hypothetical protein NLG97_g4821 [Lecanicillium saksenae]